MNFLFICSRNKWRSLTAETIFKNIPDHSVKSAGTENDARIRVTEKLIHWADVIFVMEKKHKTRLLDKFENLASEKKIIVLDITDEYKFMDVDLIVMLENSMKPYLGNTR